jgi:transposase
MVVPLNRQARILKRHGVDLSRSTLCGWMRGTADLLEPLYRRMGELVLQSAVIHTDDTPVPVLDKSRKDTRKGRLWQYYGDDAHPHVVFDYTPNCITRGCWESACERFL